MLPLISSDFNVARGNVRIARGAEGHGEAEAVLDLNTSKTWLWVRLLSLCACFLSRKLCKTKRYSML